jgi:hypothetical protein
VALAELKNVRAVGPTKLLDRNSLEPDRARVPLLSGITAFLADMRPLL